MPAQRDLAGQRFGRLVVLRSDGRVFWGRDQVAWLCRCDCGTELRVPQLRLTSNIPSQQMRACDACRAVPCEICGTPVERGTNAKTCSDECRAERHRRYQLSYYHNVRASDLEDTARRRARKRREWADATPEEREAANAAKARYREENRDAINARARKRHAERMATDPVYAERHAAKNGAWIARNPDTTQEYQRQHAAKRRARQREIEMIEVRHRMREIDDDQ